MSSFGLILFGGADRMDDGVTSSKCVNPVPEKVLIQPESLILAQNERWRQA